VAALHEENAKLLDDLENKNASVDAAEGVRGELAERNEGLRAQLRAAESARAEADENISRLMRANASLEEEIAAGESAVAALQEQTRESFEQMTLDREQLVERNRALAEQMTESQTRLDVVRAEAEAIIKEEQERNEALERRHEETLAELEKIGGDAALRPMLIETQQQLLRERERAAALREQNRELEEAAEAVERRKREQEGKLELLNRSLADFEKNREQSAEAMGPGFQGLDLSDDGRSVAGYSDLASVVSEIPNPNDVDGKAAAARRAKAAQNKIKFDAVKAQRNQFKAGLKAAQEEIERMREEMQTVEALKKQVAALQENMFV
jgi:chromosome segregation ATPase